VRKIQQEFSMSSFHPVPASSPICALIDCFAANFTRQFPITNHTLTFFFFSQFLSSPDKKAIPGHK
jgi:hypothetical protein